MMKRTAILFVFAILVLTLFTAMASAPQISCKEGTCSNLKITVTIQPPPNQLANIDFYVIGTSDY